MNRCSPDGDHLICYLWAAKAGTLSGALVGVEFSELTVIAASFGVALLAILAGDIIGSVAPLVRRASLLGAVLGGILLLTVGPAALGWVPGDWNSDVYGVLRHYPALFINVVFACLMLGKPIDSADQIWRRARANVVMGHVYAWGQYVVGLSLSLLVLQPWFGVSELSGAVIAIGFQGRTRHGGRLERDLLATRI